MWILIALSSFCLLLVCLNIENCCLVVVGFYCWLITCGLVVVCCCLLAVVVGCCCGADPIISRHLESLYDMLLQENICRIIEPYSVVETSHIATLMNLPLPKIEEKLSQMILDKKFRGILDAGAGCLIVYEEGAKTVPVVLAWRSSGPHSLTD